MAAHRCTKLNGRICRECPDHVRTFAVLGKAAGRVTGLERMVRTVTSAFSISFSV
jgi:hypothetical protein